MLLMARRLDKNRVYKVIEVVMWVASTLIGVSTFVDGLNYPDVPIVVVIAGSFISGMGLPVIFYGGKWIINYIAPKIEDDSA